MMRSSLGKRLPREIKANCGRYIAIFLMIVSITMVGTSFLAVMDSAIFILNENQENCKIEDAEFESYYKIEDEVIHGLNELEIDVYENFYINIDEFDETAQLRIFKNRSDINLASVFEGRLPETENEIALDRLFAKNRKLKVNDRIILHDNEYLVTATISVPDFNSLIKNNTDMVMNTQGFGIALVTEEGFQTLNKDKVIYNYNYRYKDRNLKEGEKKEIDESVQKYLVGSNTMLTSFITRNHKASIVFLEEDMGKDGPMMRVLIYILIAMIAFIFAIFVSHTVEEEALIIGTLRASGYTKRELIRHYLAPTGIVSFFGAVVGNILAYTVMQKPFEEIYYAMYCLSPFDIKFNLEGFILTTIIPIFIMFLINYIALARKLTLSPLKFLRKDLKKGAQKKTIKLPNMRFIHRFSWRVILQNRKSFLVLFLGIFMSSFLLMFGIGLSPLFTHYIDSVNRDLNYEYQYILKGDVEVEGGEKLMVTTLETYFEMGDRELEITFMGIDNNTEYFTAIPLSEAANEITLSHGVAKKLGLKLGDQVTFQDPYSKEEYELKVTNIVEYSASMSAFMEREHLNQLLDKSPWDFNSYVSKERLLIEDKYVAKVITRPDLTSAINQVLDEFDGILYIINIFSIVIYLIVMYLLTKLVIEKNAVHMAFMKVFGYNSKEISKLYLRATTIVVIISLFLALPLETLLFKLAIIYVSVLMDWWIDFYSPWYIYLIIIAMGLVSYFVIGAFHRRRIKNIEMNRALKNRE